MVVAAALPLGLDAQSPDFLSEEAYLDELPMVLTGSRMRQTAGDSPVSVTIIDREMIEASGAREIQELLRLVPGMVVSYTFGHWAAVTPGFGTESYSRRIEVLVDGRSVYTPSFGGVPWAALPYSVTDIDRIEVTRGPNASAFGTNALLGTINIITRGPMDRSGGEIEFLAGQDYVHRAQIRHFGSTERTDWSLSAAQEGDSGFDNQRFEWDGKSHHFFNAQMRFQTGPASSLHARAGINRGRHEWGRSSPDFDPPRDQYWNNHYGQLNWEYRPDTSHLLEVQLQHSEEGIDERHLTRQRIREMPGIFPYQAVVDESRTSTRSDIEFQHTVNASARVRWLWGAGAREDTVRSPEGYFPDGPGSNTLLRLFGQLEWSPSQRYTVNLGAMTEHDEITGTATSPRIALNYHATPSHTLRVAGSRATRTPVLIEEYGDWSVDSPIGPRQVVHASGGLQREKVDSVEVGHLFQSPGGRVHVDSRLHHDHITDIIMYIGKPFPEDPFNGFTIDFANTDDARVTGLETTLEYRPTRNLRFRANYAYKQITSTDQAAEISKTAPRNNVSFLGLYRFTAQTDFSIGYFYYDGYNMMNLNDGVDRTQRWDLRLAHRLGQERDNAQLALVVQSVDGPIHDTRPRNRFNRRIFGEIRIPF